MSAGDPLARLNACERDDAERLLLDCCGSRAWASQIAAARPFADRAALLAEADRAWFELDRRDWLEAFASHPRIGERSRAPSDSRAARWSAEEQGDPARTTDGIRAALAEANAEYERRFGHIFIVCATGLSQAEMLARLRERLGHDPETELRVAAAEQAKITRLRLEKLLS